MIVLVCNGVPVAYTKSERRNQLKESNETKAKKRWAGGVSRAEKYICDVQRVVRVCNMSRIALKVLVTV